MESSPSRKRQRPGDNDSGDESPSGVATEETKRRSKKKYALVFGYVGEKYHGLQYNMDPAHPTIEQFLLAACHQAGLISDVNMNADKVTVKIQWQRASRTDRGVHALRNLISAKFLAPDSCEACVEQLNDLLPKDIRVHALVPVTGSYNSYHYCTARVYDYWLPSYGFLDPDAYGAFFPLALAPSHSAAPAAPSGEQGDPTFERIDFFSDIPDDPWTKLRQYRLTSALLQRARGLFKVYEKTHRFHNFTPGGATGNPSMDRYIRGITLSDPVVLHDGAEWIKIRLEGQSFMLNQIRRMIGTVCVMLAADLTESFLLQECLSPKVRRGTPMAPANGLLLRSLEYNTYNGALKENHARSSALDKVPIEFNDDAPQPLSVQELEKEIICSIAQKEAGERIMGCWLRSARGLARVLFGQVIPPVEESHASSPP